jgi:hypothetical protein
MEITSITPAVKIIKEQGMMGCDIYIALGDKVSITDFDGNKFEGIFLFMDLGKDVEEDDSIVLDVNGKNVEFQCSYIKDIEEI